MRLLILLALVALTGLACKAVTGLGEVITPEPTWEFIDTSGDELVFTPAELPEGQLDQEYSVQVVVEGAHTPVGEFILQDGQYPPGLDLEVVEGVDNTAVISGTPTEPGTYTFVIYVWCYGTQVSGQTGEKEYTIVVR